MSDLSALISIREVVRETLFLTKNDDSEYKRFLQYAINGFREMNKHHYKNTKRTKLTMDSNYIIPFPSDMVLCVNIYIPLNGEYVRLTKKDTIVDTTSLQSGVVVRNTDDGENEDILITTSGFKGGALNSYGYYTEDKRNARFIFLTNYRTEVIVDYITNGISTDDDNIPTMCKQALQAWIKWQNALDDRKYNLGEKQIYKQNWDEEIRMLRNFQAPSLQEMADYLNNSSTQLPTR